MRMMGDIKRQIGIGIPSNTENKLRRKGNEHVKAIALRSGNVLGSPEDPNQEVNIENTDDLQERPLKAKDESELEEVVAPEFEPDVETTKDSIVEIISFPSRLEKKQMRDEDEFVSFLNFFKTLNINLALMELI